MVGAKKHPASGALLFRGAAAVHGVLCAMLEAPGVIWRAASAPRDAPLILAPTRSPSRVALPRQTETRARAPRPRRASGVGVPKGVPRRCRGRRHGNADRAHRGVRVRDAHPAVVRVAASRGALRRTGRTTLRRVSNRWEVRPRFNAAVAVAAGTTPRDEGRTEEGTEEGTEVALERAEGYYTPRERRRVGGAVRAPDRAGPDLARAERARGVLPPIPPTTDGGVASRAEVDVPSVRRLLVYRHTQSFGSFSSRDARMTSNMSAALHLPSLGTSIPGVSPSRFAASAAPRADQQPRAARVARRRGPRCFPRRRRRARGVHLRRRT